MSDDQGPLSPYEREQARLIREAKDRAEQKKSEENARMAKLLAEHRGYLEQIAEDAGAYKDEKPLAAEILARQLAKENLGIQRADEFATQAVDGAQNALDLKQQAGAEAERLQEKPAPVAAQKPPTPEVLQPSVEEWQQTPGSVKATERVIAEQLGQKERMNNADMDRLANLGPNQNNYQPLSANEINQRFGNPDMEARYNQQEDRRVQEVKTASASPGDASADEPRKGKETGLMADYVTQKTKDKVNDDLAKEAVQQQWKSAASGMTR